MDASETPTRHAQRVALRRARKRRGRLGLAAVLVGGLATGGVVAAGPALASSDGPLAAFGHHQRAAGKTSPGRVHAAAVHARIVARMEAAALEKNAHRVALALAKAEGKTRASASSSAETSSSAAPAAPPASTDPASVGSSPPSAGSVAPAPADSGSPTAPETALPGPGSSSYGRYGKAFDVDPGALPWDAGAQIAAASPEDRALISKITSQPTASWFGDWNRDVTADVLARVEAADRRGGVAPLVAYNIHQRDCGFYC